MQTASQLANAPLGNQAEYQRHRPETTVLYRIVEQNWPKLEALLADEILPDQPIRQWVLSFPFQLRILLAWHPEWMTEILGIVWRVLSQRLIRKAGRTQKTARTGAVTLIQRFGSALNLNIHFHILLLDGVYADNGHGKMRFYRVKAPTGQEVRELLGKIVDRVAKRLVKRGSSDAR